MEKAEILLGLHDMREGSWISRVAWSREKGRGRRAFCGTASKGIVRCFARDLREITDSALRIQWFAGFAHEFSGISELGDGLDGSQAALGMELTSDRRKTGLQSWVTGWTGLRPLWGVELTSDRRKTGLQLSSIYIWLKEKEENDFYLWMSLSEEAANGGGVAAGDGSGGNFAAADAELISQSSFMRSLLT
ncbi:hypothetical protein MA16_Dca007340 [Dendrobium catenatum]|uniref:Uncharacterized protein n=1 Tax=Dendrobium catenatum TaxID=906689 RepID=A0A2I0W8I4_9ASPA|nr:hypothetical protein MA16_Dca007340 [Dendrobium catenatum]